MNRAFRAFGSAALLVVAFVGVAVAQTEKKLNVLCVCAHPDDAELNCGGTLLRYHKAGHNVFVVLTTSGNTGSNVMTDVKEIERVRESEMLASAQTYGAKVRFLRADDERLLDTNEMRTKVLDAMRWADPDVIFTHAPTDESPDHWMTARLVKAMVLSLPGVNQQSSEKPCTKKVSVFTWENDACVGSRQPEVYVDISDVMEQKLRSFRSHVSQVGYMGTFEIAIEDDVKIPDRFRGLQAGCEYAECFNGFRIHGYMPDFRLLP